MLNKWNSWVYSSVTDGARSGNCLQWAMALEYRQQVEALADKGNAISLRFSNANALVQRKEI